LLSLYLDTQAFVFQGGGNSEFYRVSTRFLVFIIFLEKFSSSNVPEFSSSQNNITFRQTALYVIKFSFEDDITAVQDAKELLLNFE